MFTIRSRVGIRPARESSFRVILAIDSLEDRHMLSAIGFTPRELFPHDRIVDEITTSIRAADMDGDGDQDLVSAHYAVDWIAWHENTDGAGTFSDPVTIEREEEDPLDAYPADIDGDGDLDLLATFGPDRNRAPDVWGFAWYENTNGDWPLRDRIRLIPGGDRYGADAVQVADVDGDGDPDLLSLDSEGVGWHENDRGKFPNWNNIWTMPESETAGFTAPFVHAADIDADGDVDALSINRDRDVMFHENVDGRGTFATRSLIPNPDPFLAVEGLIAAPQSVHAADVDGDNDLDILTVSGGQSGRCDAAGAFVKCDLGEVEFAWYENNGTVETLGPKQVISIIPAALGSDFVNGPRPRGTDYVNGMRAADLDGDGDQDILAYSSLRENSDSDTFFDKIIWFENLGGNGTFADEQFISTKTNGLKSVDVADIDSDGDLDVVATYGHYNRFTEQFFGNIVWFENEERVSGDSNRDGIFDSADLVAVFKAGEYEDDVTNNSTFEEGDWNGDGDFDSSDLVAAFQSGSYVRAATLNLIAVDHVFDGNRDRYEHHLAHRDGPRFTRRVS